MQDLCTSCINNTREPCVHLVQIYDWLTSYRWVTSKSNTSNMLTSNVHPIIVFNDYSACAHI